MSIDSEMLYRIYEIANELMLNAEDSRDELGAVELDREILSRLWDQVREYNEFIGPGGVQ